MRGYYPSRGVASLILMWGRVCPLPANQPSDGRSLLSRRPHRRLRWRRRHALRATEFGLFDVGWSPWVFVLCFILDDFRKHWAHRAQHSLRWFWAAHVTHDSSQHYNLAVALRNPPTVYFTQLFVFRLPLAIIGFPIEMILFVAGIDSIYQFFTHTELVGKLPKPVEFVLTTPSHHRVHHATNPKYLDANYAAVFILWDRIFGTFIEEDEDEPVRYGLVKNLGSFHPMRVALHEWIAMTKDQLQGGLSLSERWLYVFGPPGYSHDQSRETTAMIRARHARVPGFVSRVGLPSRKGDFGQYAYQVERHGKLNQVGKIRHASVP